VVSYKSKVVQAPHRVVQSSFGRLCLPASALEAALQKPANKPAADRERSTGSAANDQQPGAVPLELDQMPPLEEASSDDSGASGSVNWMQVGLVALLRSFSAACTALYAGHASVADIVVSTCR